MLEIADMPRCYLHQETKGQKSAPLTAPNCTCTPCIYVW